LGDGARGVEFALVACVAEFDEDAFVNGAEDVAVFGVVKVEAVELVDDSAHRKAGLHIVVGAVEDFAHEGGALGDGGALQIAQLRKESVGGVIDESEEWLACDAFGIERPGAPLEAFRNDGGLAVANTFQLLIFIVEDLEEEHPTELLESLRIAGDALVFVPHDVADVFDDGGDIGHL